MLRLRARGPRSGQIHADRRGGELVFNRTELQVGREHSRAGWMAAQLCECRYTAHLKMIQSILSYMYFTTIKKYIEKANRKLRMVGLSSPKNTYPTSTELRVLTPELARCLWS